MSPDDERAIVREAQMGSEIALQWIADRYAAMASRHARLAGRASQIPLEDLAQEGYLGLMAAVRSYRHDHGSRAVFSTWADCKIRAQILEAVRTSDGGIIAQGRIVRERMGALIRSREAFFARAGREPYVDEWAAEAGLTRPEFEMAMLAGRCDRSLDETVRDAKGEGTNITLGDLIADPEAVDPEAWAVRAERLEWLREAVRALSEADRTALALRFAGDDGSPMTNAAVCARMDISESAVWQRVNAAIARTRAAVRRRGAEVAEERWQTLVGM